jgi:hypothetical protein
MYTATEMKKPTCQRTAKASSIELSSDMPWVNFHEEMKMQAAKLFAKPIIANIQHFRINYTIPRIVTSLVALETSEDYNHLINIVKNKKNTTIKVQIIEIEVYLMIYDAYIHH